MASLLLLVGAVWALQGYGELGGSFMTGRPEWLWIGVACMLLGGAMLIAANTRGRGPPAG